MSLRKKPCFHLIVLIILEILFLIFKKLLPKVTIFSTRPPFEKKKPSFFIVPAWNIKDCLFKITWSHAFTKWWKMWLRWYCISTMRSKGIIKRLSSHIKAFSKCWNIPLFFLTHVSLKMDQFLSAMIFKNVTSWNLLSSCYKMI